MLFDAKVSIVVPAYNEQDDICPTLARICQFMAQEAPEYEVLIVDDGSADSTVETARACTKGVSEVRILQNGVNMGKGFSVRSGVLNSTGRYVLMTDADLSTPIEEVARLYKYISDHGYDIAIGSRGLKDSDIAIHQPWYREMMGKTFNLFVRLILMGGFRDTQCGFKLFRAEAGRTVFERCALDGFAFDVEAIFIAGRLGYKIKEVPVRWLNSLDSKVSLLLDPARMFLDLFRIRLNAIMGKYRLG